MKPIWGALAVGATMAIGAPALADVKAGVDAWQQGDYARAISVWRPLAEGGDADAQFNMGQAYKLGRGVQPDLSAATDWYRRAATQGHLRAEDNLGLVLFQQGDRANAMPYLQRSSMRGEPRAQYLVGTALFNGDLAGKDWVRAYALMTRAAASGLPQATASLQQMDKYIPENQRKQGLAMASSMESQEKTALAAASGPTFKPATSAPVPAPARPAPSTVRTAELPPSTIPATLPPPARTPEPVAVAQPQPPSRPSPPAPKPAAKPAPAPVRAAAGDWRVQLGAFSEEGRARALWTKLTGSVSGLSAYQPYLVKGGNVTRLQAGPLRTSADATRLCGAIKAAGQDCLPKKM